MKRANRNFRRALKLLNWRRSRRAGEWLIKKNIKKVGLFFSFLWCLKWMQEWNFLSAHRKLLLSLLALLFSRQERLWIFHVFPFKEREYIFPLQRRRYLRLWGEHLEGMAIRCGNLFSTSVSCATRIVRLFGAWNFLSVFPFCLRQWRRHKLRNHEIFCECAEKRRLLLSVFPYVLVYTHLSIYNHAYINAFQENFPEYILSSDITV